MLVRRDDILMSHEKHGFKRRVFTYPGIKQAAAFKFFALQTLVKQGVFLPKDLMQDGKIFRMILRWILMGDGLYLNNGGKMLRREHGIQPGV